MTMTLLPTVASAPTSAGLSLRGLTKTFPGPAGPIRAVRGVDLDIAPGETVALLGPNGAGKSTIVDMVVGLTRPDAGSVAVFGRTPSEAVRAGIVGAMLQSGALPAFLTVREVVAMMASLYPDPLAVGDALAVAGVTDLADRPTTKLSGGQSQRVRVAVALVSNPDLVLLDEPTVAMDVESRVHFWESMRTMAATGKTLIFATHYLEEADANADRVVLLADGQVVADDSPQTIKALTGRRTLRAEVPDVPDAELAGLPGVVTVERHGAAVTLMCADSDAALRALVARSPRASGIEIAGAGLEAAFLALVTDRAHR